MKQKTLVVMVGIPGSGKSTVIKALKDKSDAFVYSTDALVDAMVAKGTSFNDAFKPAKKEMNLRFDAAIKNGRDIIWDQTNLAPGKRKNILTRTPPEYRRECVCFAKPRDPIHINILRQRVEQRSERDIPAHVMDSMFDAYRRPDLDEGFDKITFLDIYGKVISVEEKSAEKKVA
jgi:predicted kinase